MRPAAILVVLLWLLPRFAAQPPAEIADRSQLSRYALVLEAPPLSAQNERGKETQLRAAQQSMRSALERRGVRVLGSSTLLVNAIFVLATDEQAQELARLPGVRRVEPVRKIRRSLNRATELVAAPAAWGVVGGIDRAGQGVKIGILDSGIDHRHPAFADAGFSLPPGFPKCRGADCNFTNRKVIAARSYVDLLVLAGEPALSRPDDVSPRDRVGHGTAAASVAAGRPVNGPAAPIRGIAPGAWLGNYKIFGSPGVNDYTFDDVVIAALEDAVADGMDLVSLSFGSPALWGPNDRGSVCYESSSGPCDLLADAVQAATKLGLTVVTAAGNDGDLGLRLPTLNSIHSPGTAPSAVTVGASTNGQAYYAGVNISGNDVPANQRRLRARFGDGPRYEVSAPVRDVARLEDNGKACSPLARGSLSGAIALIQRGDCSWATKVIHAQRAGALGVILYQPSGSNAVFAPQGLADTGIPAVFIGSDSARILKQFVERQPNRTITLDPNLQPVAAEPNLVAYFSSQGPAIRTLELKPDLTAVGADLYVATQSYDPNGELYDPAGYTAAQGTSFAAPMVAGAIAILKQRNPSLTPAQLKSLVVNTASDVLDDFDFDDRLVPARWVAGGNGLLNVRDAVRANLSFEPCSLSFGVIQLGNLPSQTLKISNLSNSPVTLNFEVRRRDPDRSLNLTVVPDRLGIPPNSSREVTVRLSGTRPAPGAYEGEIQVHGGAIMMRVPFLYFVPDGRPFNIFPLRGFDFVGIVGERLPSPLTFKLIDRLGLPVAGAPVRFRAIVGGGRLERVMERTDELGIAESRAILGAQLGDQEFAAEAGGLTVYFSGSARLRPTIETSGVVNAASLRLGNGVAPGSYITIFGRGFSEVSRIARTPYLPLSLAGVSVSFDVPGRRLSLPGMIYFASENQLNVQVPWELQGFNSVQLKVSYGDYSSALYTVPLNPYSPAVFEYTEAATGRLLAAARDEAFQQIDSANPARRGRPIQIYCNGLGPVSHTPATGEATPASPLATVLASVQVTIGGRPAQVLFQGLTPGAIGLYQMNVIVPEDAPAGIQTVNLTVEGVAAKPVALPVR
ncbi:MAG: S8 family serine peptidase [Bryobacteraceae bacterium]|nr:S8 family serine peptidase [Bryobacteraceae bacterium]MDW8378856.1 S8 family serine peptidase [Bryobacterales bacterium]